MHMPRAKKDQAMMQAMCDRFVYAMESLLMLSAAETARRLGYANSTTINKVKKGESFVDVEKLQRFAMIETPTGEKINLNWIIAGIGKEVQRNEQR